jgi:hypothetical protein
MALEVSSKWKESIKSQFRYPGYLKVLLALVPDEIREGTIAETLQTERISSTVQLTDGTSAGREPVATFEKNRWCGDGTQYLPSPTASNNNEIEWWSNTVNFDEEHPIELSFAFSDIFSFAGLFVTWDVETNSWPTDWEVVGYKQNGVEQRYRVTTTRSSDEFADTPMDDVVSITIRIFKWSKPNWRVRINEVTFGTYLNFSNDNITKADSSVAVSPTMEELPTCQFSFTFSNYDKVFDPQLQQGYAKYLTRKQLLKAQWGFETSYGNIEWMEPWPLYLNSWQIPADTPEVTLTAHSRLSFMDTEYIKGVYDGQKHNMYDLTVHILENSNIIKETNPEIPWEIDETLKNLYTRAPMPISATNSLLQLIANATGHTLDTNLRNGYIRIRPPVTETDYSVGVAQQMGDPSFDIQDRLKSVKIGVHSYSPAGKETEVYKTELILTDTTEIVCYFNSDKIVRNPRVQHNAQAVQIVATYARAMVLRVKPQGIKDWTTSIIITGEVIEESVTMLEMYNDPRIPRGVEIEVDNELITEVETATYLANYLAEYYKRRNHMSVPYLGYPELEVGDRIDIPTNYGDDTGDVVSAKLTFNGGFSGTLKVISTKEEQHVDTAQSKLAID